MSENTPTNFIANRHSPEVYASFAQGFSLDNGTVKIVFSSYRTDFSAAPPQGALVEIGCLVMPIGGALGLASGLYGFLKQHNLLPPDMNDKAAN